MAIVEVNGGGNANSLAKASANQDVLKTLNWLKSKADNASSKAKVVAVWHSGASWYRKWSDGWIEQGGLMFQKNPQTALTFPIKMADTNYNVTFGRFSLNEEEDPAAISFQAINATATGFTLRSTFATGTSGGEGSGNGSYSAYSVMWAVRGYAA